MAELIPFDKSESGKTADAQSRPDLRSYSNEEVSEIIRVALRSADESRTNTVGHEEMLTIARDFGLTPGDTARAFDEISVRREEHELETKANLSLKIHGAVFAVIQMGLFAINGLSTPNYWWALYPFVCWGTLLVLHAILVRYVPRVFGYMMMQAEASSRDFGDAQFDAGADVIARFTSPDCYHGLAQCSGLMQLEDDALIFEFETRDTVLNVWRSGVKEVRVPIRDLALVRFERQFWKSHIVFRSHRLKTLEGIPGHEGGQLKLTLDKNSRVLGERIVRDLSDRIAQR